MAEVTSGFTDNLFEIAQWIRKIEAALEIRGAEAIETGTELAEVQAPQVAGLRLVSNLNNITVTWSASPITNLDFYEVHVADNLAFINYSRFVQRNVTLTYQEGEPDTTYYVRVRAKPVTGDFSEWSTVLNTETGLATVDHLGRGAATNVTDNTIDLSGAAFLDPAVNVGGPGPGPWPESAVYGNTVIRCEGGTVLPFVSFEYQVGTKYIAGAGNCNLFFEVQRTGEDGSTVVIDESWLDFYIPGIGIGSYQPGPVVVYANTASVGLATPDDPGEGVFLYSLKVTAYSDGGNGNIRMQPISINIEAVESRN